MSMRGKLISLVLLSLVGCSSPNNYTSIEELDFPAYPIKADPTCYIYALHPPKASDHEKIYTLGHELCTV